MRSGNNLVFTFDSTNTVTILDHYAGKAVELAEFQKLFTDPLAIFTGTGGTIGDDFIAGTTAADTLSGGDDGDFLIGNAGNDELHGAFDIDRMYGDAGADTFRFESLSEGVAVANNVAVTVSTGLYDVIKDFTTGSDTIQLSNTAFNLGGSLVNNINFVSLGVAYKGSNFGITSGVSHVIVDINGTVDHDADSAVVGYTVIAETDNTTPTISDFSLV